MHRRLLQRGRTLDSSCWWTWVREDRGILGAINLMAFLYRYIYKQTKVRDCGKPCIVICNSERQQNARNYNLSLVQIVYRGNFRKPSIHGTYSAKTLNRRFTKPSILNRAWNCRSIVPIKVWKLLPRLEIRKDPSCILSATTTFWLLRWKSIPLLSCLSKPPNLTLSSDF